MAYIIRPSSSPSKKWMVTLPTGRVVHFGAAGYDDYTTHGDVRRRRNYIMRHAPNEDWADASTAKRSARSVDVVGKTEPHRRRRRPKASIGPGKGGVQGR